MQNMNNMQRGRPVDQVRVRRAAGEPVLADHLTLSRAGFVDGDTAVMDSFSVTASVTLVLSAAAMTVFNVFADSHTPIRELKQSIAARADGYPVEWQWADVDVPRRHQMLAAGTNSWPGPPIDDEQPLSAYGVEKHMQETVHMLVCRRAQPRAKQHGEEEAKERPDQLLHLPVCVTQTNDIYVVDVMAWQPLLAVKWQLARLGKEEFDAQRLSLYPPQASPSTARQYARRQTSTVAR